MTLYNRNSTHLRKPSFLMALCAFLVLLPAIAFGSNQKQTTKAKSEKKVVVQPTIHKADHSNRGKVFLETADSLLKHDGNDYIILIGRKTQVKFRHGDFFMLCDSAHFFDKENSFNAYGNIHMWQGDTLNIYADSLNYLGDEEHAILYAYEDNTVKLINRDVKLETDIFEYSLKDELGFYTTGGVMTDKQNRLESEEGDYSPATKLANFYGNVYLCNNNNGKKNEIFTESLHYSTFTKIANIDSDATIISDGSTINTYNATYNTNTHMARLLSPSTITNKDGTIYTDDGDYNTSTKIANLYAHSRIRTKDNKVLEGDTLFYDRANGYGEAYGNMILTDNKKQTKLKGDYGYYNEIIDSAFVTGHALALEYSKGDTLYMHGDTVRGFRVINEVLPNPKDSIATTTLDTTHLIVVNPRVRIFRSDLQGVCDSMTFRQQDSLLIMNKFPIIWSGENRQILGNVIEVHFNDSTADWARLPETGFAAEHIEGEYFNQLSGKKMFATFENGDLRKLNIDGNVMAIYLPLESDSTYNKIVNLESSFLEAHFNEQTLERCKIWSQSNGTVTPLYLAKKSLFYLPKFKWHKTIRPKHPMDVFNVSPEMEEMRRSTSEPSTPQRHTKSN